MLQLLRKKIFPFTITGFIFAFSVAAALASQINLGWVPSTDNVGVASYSIFRGTATGGPYEKIGTSTAASYSDTAVVQGTTYYYVVRAYDAAGNGSGNSNEAVFSVPASTTTSTKFAINDKIYATSNLKSRNSPSLSSKSFTVIKRGTRGTIIEGPTTGSGYTWWQVKWDTGATGWSVQDYLSR